MVFDIKQLLFWDVLCLLFHALNQKEITTILPSYRHINQLALKEFLLAIDIGIQKHFMSLSIPVLVEHSAVKTRIQHPTRQVHPE